MKKKLDKMVSLKLNVRLDDGLLFGIEEIAILWGLDKSDVIRLAIRKFLSDPSIDFSLDYFGRKKQLRVESERAFTAKKW